VGYCRHCTRDEDDSTFSKEWGHFEKCNDGPWVRAEAAVRFRDDAVSIVRDARLALRQGIGVNMQFMYNMLSDWLDKFDGPRKPIICEICKQAEHPPEPGHG
jgi:hypothetical protein